MIALSLDATYDTSRDCYNDAGGFSYTLVRSRSLDAAGVGNDVIIQWFHVCADFTI